MADINVFASMPDAAGSRASPRADGAAEPELFEFIELLFFAYRDFVSDPDEILARYGFGRAHHRVVHFVDRNPGMTVAELLDILRITKQSLARVLRELIDSGHVEQRPGATDRRQRLLYTTPEGRSLAAALAAPQSRRIRAALDALGPGAEAQVRAYLTGLINEADRAEAQRLSRKT